MPDRTLLPVHHALLQGTEQATAPVRLCRGPRASSGSRRRRRRLPRARRRGAGAARLAGEPAPRECDRAGGAHLQGRLPPDGGGGDQRGDGEPRRARVAPAAPTPRVARIPRTPDSDARPAAPPVARGGRARPQCDSARGHGSARRVLRVPARSVRTRRRAALAPLVERSCAGECRELPLDGL